MSLLPISIHFRAQNCWGGGHEIKSIFQKTDELLFLGEVWPQKKESKLRKKQEQINWGEMALDVQSNVLKGRQLPVQKQEERQQAIQMYRLP